jgi:hypothetical protein
VFVCVRYGVLGKAVTNAEASLTAIGMYVNSILSLDFVCGNCMEFEIDRSIAFRLISLCFCAYISAGTQGPDAVAASAEDAAARDGGLVQRSFFFDADGGVNHSGIYVASAGAGLLDWIG